jgi:ABC-type transport system involved in multi-copper enzyme maturation permease subunit
MNAILLALCWKEYRELRWSVLSILAITLSLPLYALVREPDTAWFWVLTLLVLYAIVGGLCFGMWAAAGERAARSADFLASLPVRTSTLGLIKLGSTIIAVLIPVALLTAFGYASRPIAAAHVAAEVRGFHWFAGICAFSAVHIALTTAVFGAGQRSELLAAAMGLLALAIWGVVSVLMLICVRDTNYAWVGYLALVGPPLPFVGASTSDVIPKWPSIIPLASLVALANAFVLRYAVTLQPLVARTNRRAGGLMPLQISGRVGALAWKQARESAPLVGLALSVALLLSLLVMVADAGWQDSMLARLTGILGICTTGVGFILALILGVAAFSGDLEPKVNTFWRSRPIAPTQWFWSKYAAALGTLVFAVGLPALGCVFLGKMFVSQDAAPSPAETDAIGWIALGWFGIFSAGVVATCIVRRPLHSGILALGLAAAGLALAQWLDEGWFGAEPLKRPLLIAGVWLIASIAATCIAWWAAVRDVVAFEPS